MAILIGEVSAVFAALLGLNDRHFSSAKGLRISSLRFAVAVSALLYIESEILSFAQVCVMVRRVNNVFCG